MITQDNHLGGTNRSAPLSRALILLAAAMLSLFGPSSPAAEEQPPLGRPRIGLVLGGGGARGAAHVGVLKVLEEMNIPVDVIAGTSMGSIVGGLYAMGMSPAEIQREMLAMDWRDLFQDEPPREDRSFRRKRDDDMYTFKAKPGLKDSGITMPMAFIRGQKLDLQLNRLTLPVSEINDFDRLPIPYRAVGTDIETGEAVVLASGSMARAIRASMAVPAAFDPVEIDGRLLVDGGLAANVPVRVARAMGAQVFIVVDVGSGLAKREAIKSGLDVTSQLSSFLFTLTSVQDLRSLTARDVLIKPPLGDIGGGSFERVGEAMPIGEQAARELREELARFSLPPEDYQRHLAQRGRPRQAAPLISFVRIANQSRLSDELISSRISQRPGEPLDLGRLEQDIGQLYGLEIFSSVSYEIVEENGQKGLLVTAKEKPWGPGYLQGGMAFSSNLTDESRFSIGALYTLTQINALNGEWRTGIQLADEPGIFTEIYQPLDPLSRYFVEGRLGYNGKKVYLSDADGHLTAREYVTGWNVQADGGRDFGRWGQMRLGYHLGGGNIERSIGEPAPDRSFRNAEVFATLLNDKLDNINFPRKGSVGWAEWRGSRQDLGADADFDQFRLSFSQAVSLGQNTLIATLQGNTTLDDKAQTENLFRSGGFLRLSGLQDDQLSGQHSGLARLICMRRIEDIQFFQAYLGASFEAGNVWQRESDVSLDDLIYGGSIFLGLDTVIGPLYLGYGLSDLGDSTFYLYLGPLFSFGR